MSYTISVIFYAYLLYLMNEQCEFIGAQRNSVSDNVILIFLIMVDINQNSSHKILGGTCCSTTTMISGSPRYSTKVYRYSVESLWFLKSFLFTDTLRGQSLTAARVIPPSWDPFDLPRKWDTVQRSQEGRKGFYGNLKIFQIHPRGNRREREVNQVGSFEAIKASETGSNESEQPIERASEGPKKRRGRKKEERKKEKKERRKEGKRRREPSRRRRRRVAWRRRGTSGIGPGTRPCAPAAPLPHPGRRGGHAGPPRADQYFGSGTRRGGAGRALPSAAEPRHEASRVADHGRRCRLSRRAGVVAEGCVVS
ncbi:hypothetical protein DBV15_02423 [Temnothorax longispinosus]|uniref:Uncharacterized protein n=1 Tax=Temnothorax longispinosus TaxID=300112 RepID=A0A4S2KVT7_9HYME|nr:hypothetical protein DBV15_02423 [Temnothorax longispinosus]